MNLFPQPKELQILTGTSGRGILNSINDIFQ